MKKRTLIVLTIIAVLTAMCFSACGKKASTTLESYINDNPDVKAEVDEQLGTADTKGVTVEFSENDLIYNYDLANMEDITEEIAKDENTKAALDAGLEEQAGTFVGVANSILDTVKQDGVELDSIKVVVNYKYGDEIITSRTYESGEDAEAPAASDDAAEESDGE